MRRLILSALFALSLPVLAQSQTPPPGLQPLPEPPPAPPGLELDPALEPQVTITKRGEETVEEFRLNGKLYMMRVIPRYGAPFYLIDNRGDGNFSRMDHLDSGVRPPMWVIHQF
ncbi:MAG: DUF2782 domain-containing protein [Betaproteobacteria bacterium]|nr:DUF2782 domain-containing protein [Betaproteobacteria bacterium]